MDSWDAYKFSTATGARVDCTDEDWSIFNAVPDGLLNEYARVFGDMHKHRPLQLTPVAFRGFVVHHRRIDIAAGRVQEPKAKSRLVAVTFVGED